MMDLIVGSEEGIDGNGSPVPYYYVTCKKFRREFETETDLMNYIKAYRSGDLREAMSYGKLTSTLSEID